MEAPVARGRRLFAGEGIAVWETDDAERLILEFAEGAACDAACRISQVLWEHALSSSFLERLGDRSLLIRRVEPLGVEVVAEALPGENRIAFEGPSEGLTRGQRELMEDAARHAARVLRARLSLRGVERIRLRLGFGIAPDGACLLQVVNPLICDLGTPDMGRLVSLLGG